MKKPATEKSIDLPLSLRETLFIIDRDATIISSRQIAYGCYLASFDQVIRKSDPEAGQLSVEHFSRAYHPFARTGVYEVYYPRLKESEQERIGEVSWDYYIGNYHKAEFNLLIPGMDKLIRALKEAGAIIAILTASESDGRWMKHYRIPVDSYFSVHRLRNEKIIAGKKPEAIRHILKEYGKPAQEAVTIGDNPKDHVEEVISIGSPFGLDSPDARRDLKAAVDLYASRVEDLYEIFGLESPSEDL
ncbi:MAG: HAD hydrolase-like protein [Candidatus Erginobacter occultus]|nr:HAD hydrolase-like protein [Candidatus Erginobacter occultus]